MKTVGLDIETVAFGMARDGFAVAPGAVDNERLKEYERLAEGIRLTERADYPGSQVDVGFVSIEDESARSLMNDPPLKPLLEKLLGSPPVFINAWLRIALPRSPGAVWHQDLQREFWPAAINVAIYLDNVTADNGPTLVVPGTHHLPHPEFDDRVQPGQKAIVGPAGTVALTYPTTWHRGAANLSGSARRALFCYYRAARAVRGPRPPDPEPGQGWVLKRTGEKAHPSWNASGEKS